MSTQVPQEANARIASSTGTGRDSNKAPDGDTAKMPSLRSLDDQTRPAPNLAMQIDTWAGKQLCPMLGLLSRATRQSKAAVARLFWFLAALDGYYHAADLFSLIVFSAMTALMLVAASSHADRETRSRRRFRVLGLAILCSFIVRALLTGSWAGTEFWVLVTLAQYAALQAASHAHSDEKRMPNG